MAPTSATAAKESIATMYHQPLQQQHLDELQCFTYHLNAYKHVISLLQKP